MSVSIDDLVSSLAANHIGQEAIDLANLQAQLAQTLYYQSHQHGWGTSSTSTSNVPTTPAAAPCNTPTTRTPSSSFSWSMHDTQQHLHRRRSSSTTSMNGSSGSRRQHELEGGIAEEDMMMEADEEYAVEQMLQRSGASSPVRLRHDSMQGPSSSPIALTSHAGYGHGMHGRHNGGSFAESTASPSAYGSADPFYAAAEAASRNVFQPQQGFFAQIARPAQHSPFYAAQHQQVNANMNGTHTLQPALTMDARPRFVVAGGSSIS